MRKFNLMILLLLLFAHQAFADQLKIGCESINRWNEAKPTGQPLSNSEVWKINFVTDFESASIKATHFEGQSLVDSFQTNAVVSSQDNSISFYLGHGGDQGRFTINHLSLPAAYDPFFMYGWSSSPLTVKIPMEYRCVVQGYTASN